MTASSASTLSLVLLAAGLGSRYGGLKQLDAVGPHGATLMDYAAYDAARAGIRRIVFIIREDMEELIAPLLDRWRGRLDVRTVYQHMDPARTKPWGTAHALIAAEPAVDGGFLVANADDFYGAEAYAAAARHLGASDDWAVVGYPIEQTLSNHGSVNRAILRSEGGYLVFAEEARDIVASDTRYRGTLVSMNLWAFTPKLFPVLHRAFDAFAPSAGPRDELLLPDVVGREIREHGARVKVLETAARWFGMTHAADRERVAAALRDLVQHGVYPERLA
jgi:NDP-sugar pyrophosphorylase family protein